MESATCRRCGESFEREPGRGRPRLYCQACPSRPRGQGRRKATPRFTNCQACGVERSPSKYPLCPSCGLAARTQRQARRCACGALAAVRGQGKGRHRLDQCEDCLAQQARERAHARAARTLAGAIARLRKGLTLEPRRCIHCGAWFTSNQPAQNTCSREHARAHHRHNAKARRRERAGEREHTQDVFGLWLVAERDNWICQLCGIPVWRDAPSNNALEPTKDHVIPLGKGGRHELANLQLAHRCCNSRKRDGEHDGRLLIW
jgi:hypothetical protein